MTASVLQAGPMVQMILARRGKDWPVAGSAIGCWLAGFQPYLLNPGRITGDNLGISSDSERDVASNVSARVSRPLEDR